MRRKALYSAALFVLALCASVGCRQRQCPNCEIPPADPIERRPKRPLAPQPKPEPKKPAPPVDPDLPGPPYP